MSYFNNHTHSEYSNALLGFPDVVNKVPELIQKAYDIGLAGFSLTDHEGISAHIQALKYYNSMQKDRDFKLALGNEIYLMSETEDLGNRNNENYTPYYHFILIALDTEGHEQIRELSTRAWLRGYMRKGIMRRPTYYSDIEEIIKPNQGHVIASSACLGSYLDKMILKLQNGDKEEGKNIYQFVEWCLSVFGKNNFFLEIQPCKSSNKEQMTVNSFLWGLSEQLKIPIIATTDAHYLSKDTAFIHKTFLQSKDGDREVDEFYATAYLMGEDELREYLKLQFTDEQINTIFQNSMIIYERVKEYQLEHMPVIPQIPKDKISNFKIKHEFREYYSKYPDFGYYANVDNLHDSYFFYRIEDALCRLIVSKGKDLETYIARLNKEFHELKIISEAFNSSMASYYTTMSKIVELIWGADSLSMPARGCFTKEALVWTKYGLKTLNNVDTDDEVLSADGNFNRVLNTWEYEIEEELIEITYERQGSIYYKHPNRCTKDHKILCLHNGAIQYQKATEITVNDYVCLPKIKHKGATNFKFDLLTYLQKFLGLYSFKNVDYTWDENYIYEKTQINHRYQYSPHWCGNHLSGSRSFYQKLSSGSVQRNIKNCCLLDEFFENTPFKSIEDYIKYCNKRKYAIRKIKRYIDADEKFNCFIGLMLGDGYISFNKGCFMLAINNSKSHHKNIFNRKIIEDISHKIGLKTVEIKSSNKNLSQIFIYSRFFTWFLTEILFKSSANQLKTFPKWVLEQPKEKLRWLYIGMLKSDGSINLKTNKWNFDNTSLSLISLMKYLSNLFNSNVLAIDYRESHPDSRNEKWIAKSSYKLRGVITEKKSDIIENENYWFLPVHSVKLLPKQKETVYDLTIENNPSYTIHNMCVHNSGAGFLVCYLLEITQIDPVPLGDYFPYWRHLSAERGVEIADIDNDSQASKKEDIIQAIKNYFGEDRVLNVATFSELTSKTAIERSCKGLGISDETAGYLKSLIPVERGKIWSLKDCLEGNKKKGRKKITEFINEINKYEHLKESALGLEGLIVNRGVHAAGVCIGNEPYVKSIAAILSPKGVPCTCYDLYDAEFCGQVKVDMLTIVASDKIRVTMDLLLKYGHLKWQGSLKDTYWKYLHPDVLNYNDSKMWDIIKSIYSVFQFDTPVSVKALNQTSPKSVMDLSATNSLLRLMAQDGGESPIEKYTRFKNDINNWYHEMTEYGLNQSEQDCLKEYLNDAYGIADSQEKIMRLSMDKRISGFNLKQSNKLRKSIAKKDPKVLEETRVLFFDSCEKLGTRKEMANYVWNVVFAMSFGYVTMVMFGELIKGV